MAFVFVLSGFVLTWTLNHTGQPTGSIRADFPAAIPLHLAAALVAEFLGVTTCGVDLA